jgi:putative ABC transport system permease protein
MQNWKLWLRWSWRDLRARWLQVLAIATIIALGTGVFAGLSGQERWRTRSLDLSYEHLNMYDLQVTLNDGSYIEQDRLADLSKIEGVAVVEHRLIVPIQFDASSNSEQILVSGRLVGVAVTDGGPHINRIDVPAGEGRTLTLEDAGQDTAVSQLKFAEINHLRPGDTIQLSGGHELRLVGIGYSPEYFHIVPQTASFSDEGDYGVFFVSLETAQAIAHQEGLVNNLVFQLAAGADIDAVQAAVSAHWADLFPNVGINFTTQAKDSVRKTLYADAKNDQVMWNMIALLFLIGAALAAFNLAGRIVESYRRQIGIGMALGLPRSWIALRPVLIGLQMALLGTVIGLLVGLAFDRGVTSLLHKSMPLPYLAASFYWMGYMQGGILGILLPFVATLIPVWRALRVQPVDAIRSGYLVAKGGGLSGIISSVPLPGRSFMQMPFKNLLRSPWRTLLTVLGIAMAIVLLMMFIGFFDTLTATFRQNENAFRYQSPDRLIVNLDAFYPSQSEPASPGLTPVDPIAALSQLAEGDNPLLAAPPETDLRIGGKLHHQGVELEAILELYEMKTAIWVPKLLKGELVAIEDDLPGIILSEKAAQDLGVSIGDTITLEHLRREGQREYQMVETEVRIIGIHDNPMRALAYMDSRYADLMNLVGITNMLVVEPAPGITAEDVKQALFTQPGIASVQAIADISDALDQSMKFITTILRLVQGIATVLAFLIAFNSTSINVDERQREIATMFAFGLRIRTVTRMQMVENLMTGVLGTLMGIAIGWVILNVIMVARIQEQLTDLKFTVTVSPTTLMISALLGVLVVTLTPILSVRRMLRMDIPSTLRVME